MPLSALCLALCLCLTPGQVEGRPQLSPQEIERLVDQLVSAKAAEREAAATRLRGVGEAGLPALRKRLEVPEREENRRPIHDLIAQIEQDSLDRPLRQAELAEKNRDHKQAVAWLKKAIDLGQKKYHPGGFPPKDGVPYLTDAYLRLARVSQRLEEFEQAARAFDRAVYYVNPSTPQRPAIEAEWTAMTGQLVAAWRKDVAAKVDRDRGLQALTGKYPLVLLHSRRYAGGGYLQSAYSFLYESTDESTHRNDVQLLFDNGGPPNEFQVNMVVGQENRIADLGRVDFQKDPDPARVAKERWAEHHVKAVPGHVYLERVQDDRGNQFYVVLQVVDLDAQGRYVAFVWRKLPGGKVVKR
jgi:tetratricopeptide (TPR) repeat protein